MNLEKLRWAIFGCGAALFAAAVVGAWQEWASTGLWILVIAGGICLLIAFTADRLTGIDVDYAEKKIGVKLNALVRGDLKVTGLSGAAGIYSFVHNQLGNDPHLSKVKIKLQDDVVKMVKDNAFSQPVDGKEVDRVLSSGSPAERVLVFGLLEGDAKLGYGRSPPPGNHGFEIRQRAVPRLQGHGGALERLYGGPAEGIAQIRQGSPALPGRPRP